MSRAKTPTTTRAWLLAGLCAAGGCLDDCGSGGAYDPTPGPGELGNGEFHYFCITDDDPACSNGPGIGNFPARVALGGRFRLQYSWDDMSKAPPDLRSAAPDRLAVQGEIFTPLASGYTAVLAVISNSDIGDLIHLDVSTPTQVAVQVERVDYFEYTAAAGQEVRFDAVTRDDSDYTLAGALDFTWAVDDPTIAEVVGGAGAHATVRMLAPGLTTLRATLGELSKEVTVVVEGEGVTTGDASTGSTGDSTTGDDSTGSTGGGSTGESSTGTTGGVL